MKKLQVLLAGCCLAMTSNAFAVPLAHSDTVVLGNVCVGADCATSEVISVNGVTLKENNNRIRFHDLSAGTYSAQSGAPNGYIEDALGQSWRMDANESINGGTNYFYINQLGLEEKDILSDGTAPDYDCPSSPGTILGTLPAGEPTENPATCTPFRGFATIEGLVLEGSTTGGVGLGSGADIGPNQVALGNETLQRRLARVADAIGETDALIKSQLDSGVLQDRIRAADELEALLDLAETEINELERMTSPSLKLGSGGIGSATWLLVLLPLVALRLNRSVRRQDQIRI